MINNTMIEFINQMEESEINYNYTKKRNYDEDVTLGFCPTCGKRLSSGDDVWETESGNFCGERCEIKCLEDESA